MEPATRVIIDSISLVPRLASHAPREPAIYGVIMSNESLLSFRAYKKLMVISIFSVKVTVAPAFPLVRLWRVISFGNV